jgi:hypothetical protein
MPPHQLSPYRDTPLWVVLAAALAELTTSREITVNTAPDYVIDYLCRELVAKKLVVANIG